MSIINSSLQKVKWEEEMENKWIHQSWRLFRSKTEEVVNNNVPFERKEKTKTQAPVANRERKQI